MNKVLSQAASPTPLLYAFLIITQVTNGIYLSRDLETPPAYALLYPLGFLWIIGWWLLKDSRRRGVNWVFDIGLFLYIAWPLILPYYLFKTRGVKALLTMGTFVAIYIGAFVLGVVLYLLLTP